MIRLTRLILSWTVLIAYCLCILPPLSAHSADTANKREIVKQAREAYYSLRRLGLLEYQCDITPVWETSLKDLIKTNPSGAADTIRLLNRLHFAMTLDPAGNVKLTHHSDVVPANQQQSQGFDQIYSGMDQAIPGVFASWSPFMLTTPFPEIESDYQLDEVGNQYRLSYKDGTARVVTIMTRDFVIVETKVSSSAFTSSVKPQLTKAAQGFVLTGYEAEYLPTSGQGVVHLNIQLDYQEVNGLQLPHKLNMDSVLDGVPSQVELLFSAYQVKHH